MLPRKQQRHVDGDSGEDRLFDRGQALFGSRNLDQQVRSPGAAVKIDCFSERGLGVVRENRRHFERHPAVDAVRSLVDRAKEVRGLRDVLQRNLEEKAFA
jgi:hypothetical protein